MCCQSPTANDVRNMDFFGTCSTLTNPTDETDEILNLQLTYETLVFILTLIKVIEHRCSNQIHNPLMQSLHYGQIIYNVRCLPVMDEQLHMGDDNGARHTDDATPPKGCLFQPSGKRSDVPCGDSNEYADRLGTASAAMEHIVDFILTRYKPESHNE
ncbi:hypothetical protein FS837_010165 [Tulasnella sp. UAMH 9824]|nr:hypothetical protein FS837_010165 [Tulasnella sp. UAMH 9824]